MLLIRAEECVSEGKVLIWSTQREVGAIHIALGVGIQKTPSVESVHAISAHASKPITGLWPLLISVKVVE